MPGHGYPGVPTVQLRWCWVIVAGQRKARSVSDVRAPAWAGLALSRVQGLTELVGGTGERWLSGRVAPRSRISPPPGQSGPWHILSETSRDRTEARHVEFSACRVGAYVISGAQPRSV